MMRHKRIVTAALTLVAAAAVVGSLYRLPAQDKPATGDKDKAPAESAEMAAVRKTADAFTKAFNSGDARAVAAFWTKTGEYVGPDGEAVRGRAEIEKSYVEFFKNHPKATIEVEIQSA